MANEMEYVPKAGDFCLFAKTDGSGKKQKPQLVLILTPEHHNTTTGYTGVFLVDESGATQDCHISYSGKWTVHTEKLYSISKQHYSCFDYKQSAPPKLLDLCRNEILFLLLP